MLLAPTPAVGRGSSPAAGTAASAMSVTAWLPYWEMPAALSSALGGAGSIGTASPYWFTIKGERSLQYEPGAGSDAVVSELHARGLRVVPMVTEQAGMSQFDRILASSRRRAALVHTLVAIASHDGYDGLDLDFESFAYDPRHRAAPADRIAARYPILVARACAALHAIHRSCDVAVMPRTTSAQVYWHDHIATWTYDYAALARAADHIQIMAYDDHSPGGPSGPIAPLPWVRQVIAFARSQAPPGHDELGLSAYGYDWYGPTSAVAVNANQAAALAARVHARIRWDSTQGEATLTYVRSGDRHTVWYESSRSDLERAALARQAGFAGVAVWAAGYEQPGLWPSLVEPRG